jgi:predicted negative regulator of RcsB-dependent stress response
VAKKQKVETEDQGVKPEAVHIPGGESLADRILPHLKKIFVTILVITVILVGYFTFRWWKHRGLEKDTAALAGAMDVLRRDVVPPPEAGSGSGSGSGSDAVEPPPPIKTDDKTYASYQARAEDGLKRLDGPVGDVFRGNLLFDAGRLDDAEKAYQRAASRKDLDGALAREGLGFVAEARARTAPDAAARDKALADALARFQAITATDDAPHAEYRHYHAGRILHQLQRLSEATAALEKAKEIDPESELVPLIEIRLSQIEAQK